MVDDYWHPRLQGATTAVDEFLRGPFWHAFFRCSFSTVALAAVPYVNTSFGAFSLLPVPFPTAFLLIVPLLAFPLFTVLLDTFPLRTVALPNVPFPI